MSYWRNPPASRAVRRALRGMYAGIRSADEVDLRCSPFCGSCPEQQASRELVHRMRELKGDFEHFLGFPLYDINDIERHRPTTPFLATDGQWYWTCSCQPADTLRHYWKAPTRELAEQRIDYHLSIAYGHRYIPWPQ